MLFTYLKDLTVWQHVTPNYNKFRLIKLGFKQFKNIKIIPVDNLDVFIVCSGYDSSVF